MNVSPSNRPPLDETYVHSFGPLRSVATRLVSREDADDMVQEAYLRALTTATGFGARRHRRRGSIGFS